MEQELVDIIPTNNAEGKEISNSKSPEDLEKPKDMIHIIALPLLLASNKKPKISKSSASFIFDPSTAYSLMFGIMAYLCFILAEPPENILFIRGAVTSFLSLLFIWKNNIQFPDLLCDPGNNIIYSSLSGVSSIFIFFNVLSKVKLSQMLKFDAMTSIAIGLSEFLESTKRKNILFLFGSVSSLFGTFLTLDYCNILPLCLAVLTCAFEEIIIKDTVKEIDPLVNFTIRQIGLTVLSYIIICTTSTSIFEISPLHIFYAVVIGILEWISLIFQRTAVVCEGLVSSIYTRKFALVIFFTIMEYSITKEVVLGCAFFLFAFCAGFYRVERVKNYMQTTI